MFRRDASGYRRDKAVGFQVIQGRQLCRAKTFHHEKVEHDLRIPTFAQPPYKQDFIKGREEEVLKMYINIGLFTSTY